jgi:hypothetical protein
MQSSPYQRRVPHLQNASIVNAAMAFRNIREQALGSGAAEMAETALAMSRSVRAFIA